MRSVLTGSCEAAQAVVNELVEMVGGQGAADPGGAGGPVAADGGGPLGHVPVEGTADRVAQAGQAAELLVEVLGIHTPILKQMVLDS